MAPKTRGLWLELELEAERLATGRPIPIPSKAFKRDCDRFWARLSNAKRQRFMAAWKTYAQHLEQWKAARATARGWERAADEVAVNADKTLQLYIKYNRGAADALRLALQARVPLTQALKELTRSIKAFRTLDRADPTPARQEIVRWLRHQADEGGLEIMSITNRITAAQRRAERPPIPGNRADQRIKAAEDWLPYDKASLKRARQAAFEAGPPAEGDEWSGWTYVRTFTEGAIGLAGLWVRLDKGDVIIDRVVRKDTFLRPDHRIMISKWWRNPHDPREATISEVKCHETLSQIKSAVHDTDGAQLNVNVPRVRGSTVEQDGLMYSILTEFCGFESLGDAIFRATHQSERLEFPEPFLWRVFHSLAEVGLAMETGSTTRDLEELMPGHQEIVHRDIKPGNVWLSEPTTSFFSSYPTPKLGDYGMAFMTTVDDALNPTVFFTGEGTPGYMAPEQMSYVSLPDMQPIDRFKMLSHTNVWAVGKTMCSLAQLTVNPAQPTFRGNGHEPGDGPNVTTMGPYSEDLTSLIRACLRFTPNHRPTWDEILAKIDRAIDPGDLNKAGGLRDADAVDNLDPHYLERLPRDSYAIGLTPPPPPRQTPSDTPPDTYTKSGSS